MEGIEYLKNQKKKQCFFLMMILADDSLKDLNSVYASFIDW